MLFKFFGLRPAEMSKKPPFFGDQFMKKHRGATKQNTGDKVTDKKILSPAGFSSVKIQIGRVWNVSRRLRFFPRGKERGELGKKFTLLTPKVHQRTPGWGIGLRLIKITAGWTPNWLSRHTAHPLGGSTGRKQNRLERVNAYF